MSAPNDFPDRQGKFFHVTEQPQKLGESHAAINNSTSPKVTSIRASDQDTTPSIFMVVAWMNKNSATTRNIADEICRTKLRGVMLNTSIDPNRYARHLTPVLSPSVLEGDEAGTGRR